MRGRKEGMSQEITSGISWGTQRGNEPKSSTRKVELTLAERTPRTSHWKYSPEQPKHLNHCLKSNSCDRLVHDLANIDCLQDSLDVYIDRTEGGKYIHRKFAGMRR